jgi:ATP-dependent Zn protease
MFAIMNKELVAIHEAGHVVVGYSLGLACNEVALTPETEEEGTCGYVMSPNPMYGYRHGSQRERQATLRDACIACCGGLAAEHVFYGVPLDIEHESAQHDFRNIIEFERNGLRIKRGGWVGDDKTWRYIKLEFDS